MYLKGTNKHDFHQVFKSKLKLEHMNTSHLSIVFSIFNLLRDPSIFIIIYLFIVFW